MADGFWSGAIARLEALDDGEEAVAFLAGLAGRGSSSYTLRTYGLGLAHFLEWMAARAVRVRDAGREDVVAYVGDFARSDVGGIAVGRAPATVNHRVSVLASFFAWLVERDELAGHGPWLGRVSPVPPGAAAMAGSHGMPGRAGTRRTVGDAGSCAGDLDDDVAAAIEAA